MFKKIMRKIRKKKTENNNIIWPCDWNFQDVENFNTILSGINMQP